MTELEWRSVQNVWTCGPYRIRRAGGRPGLPWRLEVIEFDPAAARFRPPRRLGDYDTVDHARASVRRLEVVRYHRRRIAALLGLMATCSILMMAVLSVRPPLIGFVLACALGAVTLRAATAAFDAVLTGPPWETGPTPSGRLARLAPRLRAGMVCSLPAPDEVGEPPKVRVLPPA